MVAYLIGSPNELGNKIFLVSEEVANNPDMLSPCYARVDYPSEILLSHLDSTMPVVFIPYDKKLPRRFVYGIRKEVKPLLPPHTGY